MTMTTRRVVLTGAGGGIGRVIAHELAEAGIRLALCASTVDKARSLAATFDGAEAFGADFRDPAAIGKMIEEIRAGGPVDTLITCAGGNRPAPFASTTPQAWDELIAIDLRSVIQLSHAFVPEMSDRGWGRLICIASDAGRVGSRNEAVYAACKAGVIAFCKSLAREVGRRGVTCNAVSPGPTETPLLAAFRDHHPEPTEKLRKRIPLGRFADPKDIAAVVSFLCSERAGYITGQVVSVNGGLHMP